MAKTRPVQDESVAPKAGKSKAVVITVNYKSAGAALAFLTSLERAKAFPEIDVVIVDNSEGEEELPKIRPAARKYANVELIESPTNRGYFGAARFAFDHYLEQGNALPDWVIVCNPDIQIEDEEFLSRLFRQDPETVGVIAARIQALPGRVDQNPFMRKRPDSWRWANLRFISSHYAAAALWDWLWRRKREFRSWLVARRRGSFLNVNAKRESIYAAHGSFFIFSRRYFEAGGFLDGNLFLYGEEISVAEICRSLGLPVVYEPSLCVLHEEHQSTGKVLSRFTYECQKKAMQYVTSRYLSRSARPAGSCQPDLS
jgi:GT2 family glycosyltransferase